MPGADIGFVVLLAYTVFCWLFAPAILVALGVHGKRKMAVGILVSLIAVWLVGRVVESVPPTDPETLSFYLLALARWALLVAQFVLPAYALAFLADLSGRQPWMIRGRFAGALLFANAGIVWVLATKRLLVPPGSEVWLKFGAVAVALAGVYVFEKSISNSSRDT